jgi:succinate-semialdehyde dehydrogenase/glutarate-semialdehyde dehydrogenase
VSHVAEVDARSMSDEVPREVTVRDPRSGREEFSFVAMSATDLASLAGEFRSHQRAWRDLGLERRIDILSAWADALVDLRQELADAETRDTGRRRVSDDNSRAIIGAIRDWCSRVTRVDAAGRMAGVSSVIPTVTFETNLEPYPLVGMIAPWNNPLVLSTLDAVPALLAGCSVIIKPSEITPRFVEPINESILRVPELAKVFRYILGDAKTGEALVASVDALCFTGSVATGRKIAVACAERFIPSFLELGGNDPAIVTANADVDAATDAVLKGAVYNTGQMCFGTERVYVHESIVEEFVSTLVDKANRIEINWPDIRHGHLGPFIGPDQAAVVDAHLAEAIERGAQVLSGGPTEDHDGGRYMRPTVVTGVDHSMLLMQEETFGPVIPVMAYASEADAIELANDTRFGLSAAVLAGSRDEAAAIGAQLNAGAVSLQDTSLTPMIMGDLEKTSFGVSGLGGSRMGPNGYLRFLRKRALIARDGAPARMQDVAEDTL